MPNIKARYIAVSIIIVFVAAGIYAAFGISEQTLPSTKVIFIYFLIILALLIWNFVESAKNSNKIMMQYDHLEELLIDLRDGTKSYHKEKRRFDRKNCAMVARLPGQESSELVKVIDISYTGALLRTAKEFGSGETIYVSLYLPTFAQPIEVGGTIMRVDAGTDDSRKAYFDIGVEFRNISPADKDKLMEAVDLIKKQPEG